jgi:hypothetical protein
MRTIVLSLAVAIGVISPQAPKLPSDKVIIERAQNADVATLDKTIKKQRLEDWLTQTLGAGAKIAWSTTDCGEGTGSPADRGRDLPICVEPLAKLPDGRQVVLEIAMGSHQKGIDEPYGLYVIAIMKNGEPVFLKTLSELAEKLRAR